MQQAIPILCTKTLNAAPSTAAAATKKIKEQEKCSAHAYNQGGSRRRYRWWCTAMQCAWHGACHALPPAWCRHLSADKFSASSYEYCMLCSSFYFSLIIGLHALMVYGNYTARWPPNPPFVDLFVRLQLKLWRDGKIFPFNGHRRNAPQDLKNFYTRPIRHFPNSMKKKTLRFR